MISSNTQKSLFLVFIALLICSSCRFWQTDSNSADKQDSASKIHTNIPFSTKDPEIYQAEVIKTIFFKGKKGTENKTFVARKGEKFLATYQFGTKNEMTHVYVSPTDPYLIDHAKKTIQERSPFVGNKIDHHEWRELLTTTWLNDYKNARFENLGVENNLTKYLVKMEDAEKSEVLVFVDNDLQLPVRQEFYTIENGEKELRFTFEIKNFKTEAEDKLFELPKDYNEIN